MGDRPRGIPGRGIWFPILSVAVLAILVLGLTLRFDPDALAAVPLRYVDVAGLALLLLYSYAAWKRVESRRLGDQLRERLDRDQSIHLELAELTSIFEVSSRVGMFRRVEEALQFIACSAKECLDADRASLFLREGDELRIRAATGRDTEALAGVRIPVGEGVAGWVAEHRRPLLLNSRRDLEAFLDANRPERDIASALCVPLRLKDETLGVLNVNRLKADARGKFEERHLKLLSIYADFAANTIGNLRTYRELEDAHGRLERSLREVRLVQDQLVQSEKMSTIGQLISEVSHELNNPLTTTVGYAQLLSRVNRDPEIGEYLEVIRNEGMRCQRIIQNLLDFARKNRGDTMGVDLNELIEKTLTLRRYQLVIDGIELETSLSPDLPTFLADPSRLQQVFLNLLNNAAQAIQTRGGPGRIRFATTWDEAAGRARVFVEDDGPGIPDALQAQIFDPFFTTKEAGKGTGLGLSVCRGIVEEIGGRIRAGRSPLGGALFVISLPLASGCPEGGSPVEADDRPVPKGAEILVVDDDPNIRSLLGRTLSLDEHRVTTASGVEEAIDRIVERDFDLILTDLRMPGGNGLEIHDRLARARPELATRIVFFTGAAVLDGERERIEDTGRPLLHKPFRTEDLREAVRAGLDGRRGARGRPVPGGRVEA